VVLNRLLRAGEARTVRRLGAIADYVETFSDEIEALSDDGLRAKTQEFRERYADGESLDDILGEAFAVVREGASRTLGSATSACSSWAAPRCIWATSRR